jgi:hypothetical protein
MREKCFVLMPFKDPFNSYYDHVLKKAALDVGLEPIRADEIYGTRPIIEDIVKEIREASVLIAEVTGKNPNVNYEMGIAHAMKRPVVIISQSVDDIPFDYRHLRAIIYNTAKVGWDSDLKSQISRSLLIDKQEPLTFDPFLGDYIVSGLGIAGTPYDYTHLLNEDCEEVIAIGSNLRHLLSVQDFKEKISNLIRRNKKFKATFVCATKKSLELISPVGTIHLMQTVKDLSELKSSLSDSERSQLCIHFHPAAISLSLMIYNPRNDSKGILTFVPRLASDTEPENRVYCVVNKRKHRAIFNKLYGNITILSQNDSYSLEDMKNEFSI